MRGWILLALIGAGIYYMVTETTKLDKPIAQVIAFLEEAESKLDAMTGTKIIKVDKNAQKARATIAERLSGSELKAFEQIVTSSGNIDKFKDEYCHQDAGHPVFSKDNLRYICDTL
jgi:aerobic-type carbon monoxide dehydrogenase small subunit (CoxS/CutS family)